MRYAAIHYVKVNGRLYTPGEVIDGDIPPEKAERLIAIGALKIISAPSSIPANVNPPDNDPPENDAPEDDEDEGEDDDNAELEPAPEIDVSDGIVEQPSAPEEKATKPTKKPARNGGKAK